MHLSILANALFWASGENLDLMHPANSCNPVACAAGAQKQKHCKAIKVAKWTLNLIQLITQFEMFLLWNLCQTNCSSHSSIVMVTEGVSRG